jgi:hypothetical protein
MAHQWGTENKAAVAAMITYSWGWDTPNWPSNAANDEPAVRPSRSSSSLLPATATTRP